MLKIFIIDFNVFKKYDVNKVVNITKIPRYYLFVVSKGI